MRGQLIYCGSESFSYPNASSRDIFLDLSGDWRMLDSLSLVLKGEGEASQFPSAPSTDFTRIRSSAGLSWSPLASTNFSASGIVEKYSTPNYDLDNHKSGGTATLDLDLPHEIRVSAEYTRLSTAYTRRIIFNPIPLVLTPPFDLRHDESSSGQILASLHGVSAGWRDETLRSNGNALDFGPFQNIYNDTSYNDDTLIQNYYNMRRSGPILALTWQTPTWLKLSARAWFQSATWENRPAKDNNDQFVKGLPGRHDDLYDARYAADFYFELFGLDCDFEMVELTQNSTSNDALYNFSRHLTQAVLNLEF